MSRQGQLPLSLDRPPAGPASTTSAAAARTSLHARTRLDGSRNAADIMLTAV